MPPNRKKLIEVALPLAAINAASAREKSIRHGHPSTLHLWWARRPLAACRAVLFAQLVDDPSSVPEEFPGEEAQDEERKRLFGIIEELVKWENSNDARVVGAARREIAHSVARARGISPADRPGTGAAIDRFLAEKAPPVLDPFCGGGSIPLEAQRLGLAAHGSDLNPVAVLISKALVEFPPRFAGLPPVNPEARARFADGAAWNAKGAQGLAEDVRFYGHWMRDEAWKRIGHLYPKATLPDGSEATVIAWLWARTVASPNPAAGGAHVPLIRSFVLSSKKGNRVWMEPQVDRATYSWRMAIRIGGGAAPDGTIGRRGGRCLLTGAPIPFAYIRSEGKAGRMGSRLIAVVTEGKRQRIYLEPTGAMDELARSAEPKWRPDTELAYNPRNFQTPIYGMKTFADLFTARQLAALTTLSELVPEARDAAYADAVFAGAGNAATPWADGPGGPQAYAEAVATYCGIALSRLADICNTLCRWDKTRDQVRNLFARQAIPMVWDFAEANVFGEFAGDYTISLKNMSKAIERTPRGVAAIVTQKDARDRNIPVLTAISTDPPYYDNIVYADISDFFYVWLRCSLGGVHPGLFKTLMTPKAAELVAAHHRFDGDKREARRFFEKGLAKAVERMRASHNPDIPMTLFYAYKQTETEIDDAGNGSTASTGWETMLSGLINGGFALTATWPVRSELGNRVIASGTNALASSIVLACRPREIDAPAVTRRSFVAVLKRELPAAIRRLQREDIAPVDLAQAAIGPGMAVFSRYARVLEADGASMGVRAALAEINRALDETLAESESDLDAETRFCVAWFEQYGTDERPYGEAEVLLTAKNTSSGRLLGAGVIRASGGKLRLAGRGDLDPEWSPRGDRPLVDWACAQHLARALTAEHGGGVAGAAQLAADMGAGRADRARALAYRLFTAAERKGWADEARAWNVLATSWPQIRAEAARLAVGGPAQGELMPAGGGG